MVGDERYIGGYASGTVAGLQPPLGRTVLLSKLDETATYAGRAYPLSSNR